jgi:hypothetical protein
VSSFTGAAHGVSVGELWGKVVFPLGFTDRQIEVVANFAAQPVIAIEKT